MFVEPIKIEGEKLSIDITKMQFRTPYYFDYKSKRCFALRTSNNVLEVYLEGGNWFYQSNRHRF